MSVKFELECGKLKVHPTWLPHSIWPSFIAGVHIPFRRWLELKEFKK